MKALVIVLVSLFFILHIKKSSSAIKFFPTMSLSILSASVLSGLHWSLAALVLYLVSQSPLIPFSDTESNRPSLLLQNYYREVRSLFISLWWILTCYWIKLRPFRTLYLKLPNVRIHFSRLTVYTLITLTLHHLP